jgi:sec-independent protein translocase protein TatA
MGSMSLMHWLIVLAIVLVLFGAGKLPRMMGDFAKGIKAFKAGMKEEEEATEQPAHQQVTPPPGTAPAAAGTSSSAFGNGRDQRV